MESKHANVYSLLVEYTFKDLFENFHYPSINQENNQPLSSSNFVNLVYLNVQDIKEVR